MSCFIFWLRAWVKKPKDDIFSGVYYPLFKAYNSHYSGNEVGAVTFAFDPRPYDTEQDSTCVFEHDDNFDVFDDAISRIGYDDRFHHFFPVATRCFDEYRVEKSVIARGFGPCLRDIDVEWESYHQQLKLGQAHARTVFPQRLVHHIASSLPAPLSQDIYSLHNEFSFILHDTPGADEPLAAADAAKTISELFLALITWNQTFISQS